MNLTTKEITLVAIFPALMAATSWLTIPIGIGAPITLQTLFVMMAGLILGKKLGTISVFVYVMLGAIGIPVFAGMQGGIGVILGPTGGFIIAFILMAYLSGIMKNIKIINNEYIDLFLILIFINFIVYMIGGTYMSFIINTNLSSTVAILGQYIFGDFIKIVIAIYAYLNIRSYVTYEHTEI